MLVLLASIGAESLWRSGRRSARIGCGMLGALAATEALVAPSALWRDVLPTTAHRWSSDCTTRRKGPRLRAAHARLDSVACSGAASRCGPTDLTIAVSRTGREAPGAALRTPVPEDARMAPLRDTPARWSPESGTPALVGLCRDPAAPLVYTSACRFDALLGRPGTPLAMGAERVDGRQHQPARCALPSIGAHAFLALGVSSPFETHCRCCSRWRAHWHRSSRLAFRRPHELRSTCTVHRPGGQRPGNGDMLRRRVDGHVALVGTDGSDAARLRIPSCWASWGRRFRSGRAASTRCTPTTSNASSLAPVSAEASGFLGPILWDGQEHPLLAGDCARGQPTGGHSLPPCVRRTRHSRTPVSAGGRRRPDLRFQRSVDAVYSMGTIGTSTKPNALLKISQWSPPRWARADRCAIGTTRSCGHCSRGAVAVGYPYGFEKSYSRRALREMLNAPAERLRQSRDCSPMLGCSIWRPYLVPVPTRSPCLRLPFVVLDRHVPGCAPRYLGDGARSATRNRVVRCGMV